MFQWESQERHFHIRRLSGQAEYRAVEQIQKEAWGFDDLDVVPMTQLIAAEHAGGILLGAFEQDLMVGFVYGFPAHESGRLSIHSHMLAVRPAWRNLQVGFYLKLAQREEALSMGISEITWTFDPLQSLNAHLNFSKLGVTSRRYIVNFYGEQTSSPLHQGFGTDRLWVNWKLSSQRVTERIKSGEPAKFTISSLSEVEGASLMVGSEDQKPVLFGLKGRRCLIEIPHEINALKGRDRHLGRAWREATRAAFLEALGAGLEVVEFFKLKDEGSPRWFYLLEQSSS
jgi:predicted GNAT superfamily acetyltransferase